MTDPLLLLARRHPTVFLTAAVVALVVLIHWDFLWRGGCVTWDNFDLPCTEAQYATGSSPAATWTVEYLGAPITFPVTDIVWRLTEYEPIAAVSALIGPASAAKGFALASSTIVGLAFNLCAQTMVRSYWGRLLATLFMVGGEFQLQLYSQGDYTLFISEAFVFLSIYLLWRGLHGPRLRWLFLPFSFLSLFLSVSILQLFELGALLYAAFLLAFFFLEPVGSLGTQVRRFLRFMPRLVLFPLVAAPFILPAIFSSSVSLQPGSDYGFPLVQFSNWSASPISMFFGLGYLWTVPGTAISDNIGFIMVKVVSDEAVALLWEMLIVALVGIVWVGLMLTRDRRGYWLLAVTLLGCLVGAGTRGPLSSVNTYLFLYATGYQELYCSFVWEWMIVVPAFALALAVFLERVLSGRPPAAPPPSLPRHPSTGWIAASTERLQSILPLERLRRIARRVSSPSTLHRLGAVAVVLLMVATLLPYSLGAQNGPIRGLEVGLQTEPYPSDYNEIPGMLSDLIGSSYAGVAVFNPSVQWYVANSTQLVENYFLYFPTERTPILPGYAYVPYSSSFYSNWVYQEIYTNSTRYGGELFAVAGVEYFLVFYGTEPGTLLPYANGVNASELMRYQVGIVPVEGTRDFEIYRNMFYTQEVVPLSNLSIVAGGYEELNAMAYGGVNLTSQGLIFPQDIPAGMCGPYVGRVSRVYTASTNALYGLALTCVAASSFPTVADVSPGKIAPYDWATSYSYLSGSSQLSVADAWPVPLAVTNGSEHVVNVSVNVGACGPTCSLWLPIRFAGGAPASLEFEWEGQSWNVNTSRAYAGLNDSMVWVQLPFSGISGSGTLQITSLSGWNAIGSVYAASSTALAAWLQNLESTIPVLVMTAGDTIAPPISHAGELQSSGYCSWSSSSFLEGGSVCISSAGATPLTLDLTLPSVGTGELSLLVGALANSNLVVGAVRPEVVGFTSGNENYSRAPPPSWLRLPITSSDLSPGGELTISVSLGSIFLSEVTFTPGATYPPPVVASASLPISEGTTQFLSLVRQFNLSAGSQPAGVDQLSGSLEFESGWYGEPIGNITFPEDVPLGDDVALEYTLSPGLEMSVNGVQIGGDGSTQWTQVGAALFDQGEQTQPTALRLDFFSWVAGNTTLVNASFTICWEYDHLPLTTTLSDLASGPSWTVTGNGNGYQVSGGAGGSTSLLLVRIPYYSSMLTSPSTASSEPALGSINSLLWNPPSSGGTVTLITSSVPYLELGGAISAATLVSWAFIEFVLAGRRAGTFPGPRLRLLLRRTQQRARTR